jgi:hypothetical protein
MSTLNARAPIQAQISRVNAIPFLFLGKSANRTPSDAKLVVSLTFRPPNLVSNLLLSNAEVKVKAKLYLTILTRMPCIDG